MLDLSATARPNAFKKQVNTKILSNKQESILLLGGFEFMSLSYECLNALPADVKG